MNGDRWVVPYPSGEWGVERSSRRASAQLFRTMEEAVAVARQEAASAGGGEICVQAPDGGLSLSDQVLVPQLPRPSSREPQSSPRSSVAWTIFA